MNEIEANVTVINRLIFKENLVLVQIHISFGLIRI